jgi:hypothetical protein
MLMTLLKINFTQPFTDAGQGLLGKTLDASVSVQY